MGFCDSPEWGNFWLSGGTLRGEESTDWFDSLYFSVVTFTTLGFGDIRPDPGIWWVKAVAMGEALCGAILMALFVLVLGRKMMR